MLSKSYKYVLEIAPVRITWSQELVEDEDMGHFYMRLKPHVEWAEDMIEKKQVPGVHGNVYEYKKGTAGKVSASVLGATKRNEIARQGRQIFADLKKEWEKDVQKKLRAEYNKRRGQRWNKKV